MLVFSNMSDPDILLTIRAYTTLEMKLQEIPLPLKCERIKNEITRLGELNDSLINEWEKRGNP